MTIAEKMAERAKEAWSYGKKNDGHIPTIFQIEQLIITVAERGREQDCSQRELDLIEEIKKQKRKRKWALQQASYGLTGTRIWRETSDQWENRAEIFEAEVERLKEQIKNKEKENGI